MPWFDEFFENLWYQPRRIAEIRVLYCKLSQFQKIREINAGHLYQGLDQSTKGFLMFEKRRKESWQSSGWTPHNGWRWYGWPRLWRSEGFLFSKTRFTIFVLFHNEMLVGQTWLFHRAVSGEIWIVPWCNHDQQCKLVEIKMGKEARFWLMWHIPTYCRICQISRNYGVSFLQNRIPSPLLTFPVSF